MAVVKESDSCWLANSTSNGRNDLPKDYDILMDISGIENLEGAQYGKNPEDNVLPCHEEFYKENLELKKSITSTLKILNAKVDQLEAMKSEFEQESDQCEKEKRLVEVNKVLLMEETSLANARKTGEKERQETLACESELEEFKIKMSDGNGSKSQQTKSDIIKVFRRYDCLSGIAVNSVNDDEISVSILGNQDNNGSCSELEVILRYQGGIFEKLVDVEVRCNLCSWDGLIDCALNKGGDTVWLLQEIKKQFHSLYSLQEEIDALQHKYAIDFEPEQRIVTVILAGKKQLTCKLQLHSSYSLNQVVECIQADGALRERVTEIEGKVKNHEVSGLTQWLEQLHAAENI
eukprot:gene3655-4172_t